MAPDDRDEIVQIIVAERNNELIRFSISKIETPSTGHRHLTEWTEDVPNRKAWGAFVITEW